MTESKSSQDSKIREICLKLKPILGDDMEQIYTAYCLEDTEGKQQIERYLELLAVKHLPSVLEPSQSNLLPPPQEQAKGEYPLGTVKYLGKELYPFGLREDEWIQHVAILGRSGAGKTNTGFVILSELKKKGKPFLLFDWKRNYRDLLSLPDFKDVEVYTIGRNIAPFTFNPLIPPAGTNPKTWLKKLNEIIAHAYCLGNGVLFLLQQAVDAVYEEAGVYNGTVERWPNFKDVLKKARSMDTRGRETGWLSSTLRALSTLCFGDMDKLLNTDDNKSIDHILDKSVILELDAMTQSDKTFFVQAAMLYVHHKQMIEKKREEFHKCIIIEEAHHVLSDERRSLVGGQSMMDIIFREIREMGISLILLDQHPSKISLSALGNTNCTIAMNLKHRSDINAMGQCMLLEKERDILGMLPIGHAVVKLQGRIPRAFQIKIPEFIIEKGKITDDYIQQHMRNIAPAIPEEDFRLPNQKANIDATLKPESEPADNSILAFLQDIQQYPDSGIANRYKHLKISVRQGQKLKEAAIQQGLIEEHTETTKTGRIKVVRTTRKGWAMLSQQSPQ
jgi:hypothetical protein